MTLPGPPPRPGGAALVTTPPPGGVALAGPRPAAADALLPRLARLDADTLRRLTAGIEALSVVVEADPPANGSRAQGPNGRSDGRPKR